jgi:hypothetical protein
MATAQIVQSSFVLWGIRSIMLGGELIFTMQTFRCKARETEAR